MALVSLVLASCGGGGNVSEVKLSPATDRTCYGDLQPYLELYDCEYTLKKLEEYKSWGGEMLSKMELVAALGSLSSVDLSSLSISFTLLDENEMPINNKCTIKGDGWQSQFSNVVKSGLQNGKEKIVFSVVTEYSGNSPVNREEWAEIVKKAKYVSISASSASFANEKSSSYVDKVDEYRDDDSDEENDDESDTEYSSPSGSTDWDQLLDEYEKFVNSYVSLISKANNGNASALTECMEMMEKVESLSEKLDDAEDDMSTAQMNRFLKIQTKFAGAAAKLSGSLDNLMNDLEDVEDAANDWSTLW